jgi:hypothetical protein
MSDRHKRKAERRAAKRIERESSPWRDQEPIPPVELFVRMKPGGPPPLDDDHGRRLLPHTIRVVTR